MIHPKFLVQISNKADRVVFVSLSRVGGLNRHGLNSAWCTHNLLKPIWLPGNPESCWCWVFSCVMWGCVSMCVHIYTCAWSGRFMKASHWWPLQQNLLQKTETKQTHITSLSMISFVFSHAQQHAVWISNEFSMLCLCLTHIHIVHMFHFSSLGQAPVSQAESLSMGEGVCGRVNVPWRSLLLWAFSIFMIFTMRHSFNLLVTLLSPYYQLNKHTKQHYLCVTLFSTGTAKYYFFKPLKQFVYAS